ncbi:CHAP domain-containing protein [Nonomuraea sp. NPDC003727]
MAKPSRSRAPKLTYAHAALGAVVIAGSFVPTAAQAEKLPLSESQRVAVLAKAPKEEAGRPAAARPEAKVIPSATVVLTEAKKQVGVKENSAGGGTKFQNWYVGSQRARETVVRDGGDVSAYANAPWCAMFVSWVGEMTGARTQVGWDAYTVTHAKWFKANKRWGTAPKPGAVVFFAWDGSKSLDSIDHVGFVEKDNGDGTISTIEGNTGNGAVEQRVRPKSQVVGYGYPSYGG